MTYFVFDVPPGGYVVSLFNTTGATVVPDAPAYRVPQGRRSFVGTFAMTGVHEPARDLETAKLALGPAAADLELAEVLVPTNLQRMTVCSP